MWTWHRPLAASACPRRLLSVVGVVVVAVAGCSAPSSAPRHAAVHTLGPPPATPAPRPGPNGPLTATSGRPFAADSPWNAPIPSRPRIDPNSAAMIADLTAAPPAADVTEYGEPIVTISPGETPPTYRIACSRTPDWGPCAADGRLIPVPAGAQPDPGDDGALSVVDLRSGLVYSFWRARLQGEVWTSAWAGTAWLWGNGQEAPTSSRGSGIARLAGVVRTWEIPQGEIPHALVFASRSTCGTAFRYPAQKTDGTSRAPSCVPMGSRVQLDPALDVATLPATPAERVIARALQVYGAYVVDTAPSPMALSFENPVGAPNPFPDLGIEQYGPLAGIPWKRLRVLRNWNGT